MLDRSLRERVRILAVSVDTHAQSRALLGELKAHAFEPAAANTPPFHAFSLLEDVGHRVIDRYGLLNPAGRGWPHPATYVIDRDGVVRWRFVEVDYKVRPTNAAVLAALKALPELRGDRGPSSP